jgi:hypothetical protein
MTRSYTQSRTSHHTCGWSRETRPLSTSNAKSEGGSLADLPTTRGSWGMIERGNSREGKKSWENRRSKSIKRK